MDPWNTKTYRRDDFVFAYEPHVMFTADETWSHGREPVLRRMPDGSLFSTIFSGGIIEPDPGNVVLGIRSEDDGETWSRPQVVSRHPSRPTWATEVFTDGDLPLLFVHTFHCETYYFEIKSYVSTTHDSGRTWTGPVSVPGVPANFSVRTGLTLSDGAWLFPVYWQELTGGFGFRTPEGGYDPRKLNFAFSKWPPSRCGVLRSENHGQSYSLHGYIADGEINLWEPAVVEVEPGHLLMLIRAQNTDPVLYRSDSRDFGRTWTAPRPTAIPAPATKVYLLRIEDRIVLLHNPNPKARTPLALWVSRDRGETWEPKLDLITARDGRRAICYPHAFADPDRELLYVASDAVQEFFLQKIPFADFL